MKINVNNELMIAAAQIVAVQIQQDPSKGTQDELPRALHQTYYAIWLAARRLEHGADPNS